ncbi:hypothetical protein CDAR_266461 [Caerostris darwini]|uniref:Uncharacterized protein n=1 Tax=Caerostris darwini TaxID=1538125 RepID=A0AAV4Q307_9ARAC|nr:hypothetical protein CDAR_266461 [Caerostris darwini]
MNCRLRAECTPHPVKKKDGSPGLIHWVKEGWGGEVQMRIVTTCPHTRQRSLLGIIGSGFSQKSLQHLSLQRFVTVVGGNFSFRNTTSLE